MSVPQLNTRLVLEVALRTRDDAGGYRISWAYLGDLWASVKATSGREAEAAGLAVSQAAYKIIVRAAPVGSPQRPAPGQRLREGNRIFAILAVTEHRQDRRYLAVIAREEEVMA
ncbi:MAG: head-tail adaptor protein [Pseudomonadota bacterium]